MQINLLVAVVSYWVISAAAVTIYGPKGPVASSTSAAASSSATAGSSSPGSLTLTPPPIPSPGPPTQFHLTLQNSAQNVPNLSIPQSGAFYGFSIELSVADQISTSALYKISSSFY